MRGQLAGCTSVKKKSFVFCQDSKLLLVPLCSVYVRNGVIDSSLIKLAFILFFMLSDNGKNTGNLVWRLCCVGIVQMWKQGFFFMYFFDMILKKKLPMCRDCHDACDAIFPPLKLEIRQHYLTVCKKMFNVEFLFKEPQFH